MNRRRLLFGAAFVIGLAIILFGTRETSPDASVVTGGLSPNFEQASAEFTSRLQQKFPDGTKIDSLVSRLEADGFAMDASTSFATKAANSSSWLCNPVVYRVSWALDADQISAIQGDVNITCL